MRIIRTMRFIPSTDKYQSWKEFKGDNYDYCLPLHYIKNEFNYKEILLFLPILFPNFIVKDGFIFLEFLYSDEKFNKIPKGLKLNEVVEAINHLVLRIFFAHTRI